ncbi:hypothetical protein D0Z07_0667 [Hyphodiscus hymeniophilus]|uniref:Penicillin-binding protein n=1 Tax=Hyphodiscus hymeniophilus TaxID=353542 RepID=A0A9P6VRC3_9HELO|nr:hypothetical protein D0Z07_0667 [Hyphodiscus hymeniophilus]
MTRRKPLKMVNEDDPFDDEFEKMVKDTLELWHVPGVSVAVVDGDITWSKGYGIATFPSTLVSPSTLYFAGSTTKAFTAAIMSFLVDDNEKYPHLQWDTPIATLIRDDFVLENEYATQHTTIEDSLSHRTGLPGHDFSLGGPNATVQTVVRNLRHLPITAEPRTKYMYCNAMFIVASHVIETVTGRKLGDLMHEWIWKPLGMDATFFDLESAKNAKEHLATAYRWLYDNRERGFQAVDWMTLDEASGAGAVITNVLDYAKWARAILRKETPLSEKGFEAVFTPRTLIPIEEPFTGPRSYGLGWRMGVYRGQRFYEHSGGMKGFGAELIIFPDVDFAFVALANTAGTANFVDLKLGFSLVDEKLKVPLKERFDWNERRVSQRIISEGRQKAKNAVQILYPHLPSRPLPLSLPLSSYAGTYRHPAYQTLTIYVSSPDTSSNPASTFNASEEQRKSILKADRTQTTWIQMLTFEHVSGEFFVARAKGEADFAALFDDVYPVEFRNGVDGKVKEVGVGWEESMGNEKIWFRRVEK